MAGRYQRILLRLYQGTSKSRLTQLISKEGHQVPQLAAASQAAQASSWKAAACLSSVKGFHSSSALLMSLNSGSGPSEAAKKGANPSASAVATDPSHEPPLKDDARQKTPSSKIANELEKGKGAPAGKDALKPGEKPQTKGFHTSASMAADDGKAAKPRHDASKDAKDKPYDDDDVSTHDMHPPSPSGRPHDPHIKHGQSPATAGADQRN